MKNIAIRFVGAVFFCLMIAAAFVYMVHGMTQNYTQQHRASLFKTVSAGDAGDFRFAIDWKSESGLKIKLPQVANDNWLFVDLSPDDAYQVAFFDDDEKIGSIVIDSGSWATVRSGVGDKPILHLIPAYIAKEGYSSVTFSPVSGDGEYSVSNFKLETFEGRPKGYYATYNILDFEIKQLEIKITDKNFEKIREKRDEALRKGILLAEDGDVVPAKVTAEGDTYDTELRLKGDWTDHLATDQWAFRIELKGDYCIYDMQKFSIQPPATRNYIYEYLIYESYRAQGGVALRYDFADVYINGEYKGVYALEEFMEKRVIEHSQKREGPIIKLDEDIAMWEPAVNYVPDLSTGVIKEGDPIADFLVFSEKKTMASDLLTGYAQYGIDMMNRVFNGDMPLEEAFDLALYAKLVVILDIFKASHGRALHNTRYYYNPVTAKLEPIPFDEMAFTNPSYLPISRYETTSLFFENEGFRMLYKKHAESILGGFSDFLDAQRDRIRRFGLTLRRDGVDVPVNTTVLEQNIRDIETFLYAERIAPDANIMKNEDGSYNLKVYNNDSAPIVLTGVRDAAGRSIFVDAEYPVALMDPPGNASSVCEFVFDAEAPLAVSDLRLSYRHYFEESEYDIPVKEHGFSFYSVGHLYGTPGAADDAHPHPAFAAFVPRLSEDARLAFGVLTGDLVWPPTPENYDAVTDCLDATEKPYYALPGNYDEDGGGLFEQYFGARHRYFAYKDNLFLLLDADKADDGVSDAQISMIREALRANPQAENIFVFTHELIWLDPLDDRFNYFSPNSWEPYSAAMPTRFKEVILPLFAQTDAKLHFIAGDSGAFDNGMHIFYEEYDGVKYISSGIDGNVRDSILQFDVNTDGTTLIRPIALNGDNPNALGRIEDYARKDGDGSESD
jgi:hypothetical protein